MYAAQGKRRVLGTSVHTLERHLSHSRYLASHWFSYINARVILAHMLDGRTV